MTQRDAANRINLNVVNLEGLTADPIDVQEGDIWLRSDVHSLRVRSNGATYKIDCTAV